MTGLTLTLRPRERFLVGGCLVENGPRRSSIRIVDDSVLVLRLSDALHPEEVTTPVRRAYHATQMILACAIDREEGRQDLKTRLDELAEVFQGTTHEDVIGRARKSVDSGRYHAVLINLKALMPIEEKLLGVAPAATDGLEDVELVAAELPACAIAGRR